MKPEGADRKISALCVVRFEPGSAMSSAQFKKAFPYQKDVLALPVTNLDEASRWYTAHFGMTEVERREQPVPTVVLERDGTRIGFSINGGDASQDGAAVLVANIRALKDELASNGAQVGNWRIDEQNGQKNQVFFVVAPDGLCYYFFEPLSDGEA
jgi:catechol 2,3-dioxygenase-like lactoylglutathione lyase family enzyme